MNEMDFQETGVKTGRNWLHALFCVFPHLLYRQLNDNWLIYLVKNPTVLYSSSQTLKLGQLFIIKKIENDFFPYQAQCF